MIVAHVYEGSNPSRPTQMKKEFDEEIVGLCPNLYRDRYASMQATCMCWGFEIGDGWYPLIKDLSLQLESLIAKIPNRITRQKYRASQVKEKYGTLRFYMTYSTPEMDLWIDKAETQSETTCEACGASGKLRGKGWYYTACDEHTKPHDLALS